MIKYSLLAHTRAWKFRIQNSTIGDLKKILGEATMSEKGDSMKRKNL